MDKSEHEIQNEIRVAVGAKQAATIFRANVGQAWAGELEKQTGNQVTLNDARRFSTGLPNGFPDLFGFKSITVTPDMVGSKLAVFVFLEVKTTRGRASAAQKHMHEFLQQAGAVGGIARSAGDALKILDVFRV